MKPYIAKKGRRHKLEEDECVLTNPFLEDYCRILKSKADRRLPFKTQVVSLGENAHIRTRGIHTKEVLATAIRISEKLGLNTFMCMASAAGHDLGHVPYGHHGEIVLSDLCGKKFEHNIFSVVIAQHIERKGKGLNLNYETLEGMLMHSTGSKDLPVFNGKPNEYAVVMYADKIAYLFADINDCLRFGYLKDDDLPDYVNELGKNQREREKTIIDALVKESKEAGKVQFTSGKVHKYFHELKDFMYKNVYHKINWETHEAILKRVYNFFKDNYEDVDPAVATALLTDKEAAYFADCIIYPRFKLNESQMAHFSVLEILPYIKNKEIDFTNPDLDWA